MPHPRHTSPVASKSCLWFVLVAFPLGCSESSDEQRDGGASDEADLDVSETASDAAEDDLADVSDAAEVGPVDVDTGIDADAGDALDEPCNPLRDVNDVQIEEATAFDSCWVQPQGFDELFETEDAWADFLDSGLNCTDEMIETLRSLEVDFAVSSVFVRSRFLGMTCGFSVKSAQIYLGDELTVVDITLEDLSRNCLPVCAEGDGVLVAAIVPKGVPLEVCGHWVGGCE